MIDRAETKNRDATRNVINRYFDFGEALYLRYKELKPSYGKDGADALVKEEVRKQIPETKFSDDALRKRRERSINNQLILENEARPQQPKYLEYPKSLVYSMKKCRYKYTYVINLR